MNLLQIWWKQKKKNNKSPQQHKFKNVSELQASRKDKYKENTPSTSQWNYGNSEIKRKILERARGKKKYITQQGTKIRNKGKRFLTRNYAYTKQQRNFWVMKEKVIVGL